MYHTTIKIILDSFIKTQRETSAHTPNVFCQFGLLAKVASAGLAEKANRV